MSGRQSELFLVVGAGSIGKRHIRNLLVTGYTNIVVCDSDSQRSASVAQECGIKTCSDYERAIANFSPEIVLICTPPSLHVPQALKAVRAGAHVFIEKPISHTLAGVDDLIVEAEALGRIVQVGYNLRFHPGLQLVKRLLDEKIIGRILWARIEFGQYLPDWRPFQDYRQSYTSRKDLGGGIILDASHELDYAIWFLGDPTDILCMAGKISNLEVDVEDCATILLKFASGAQADIHLDFVQRGYSRSCKLCGEEGTIVWEFSNPKVRVFNAKTDSWEEFAYSSEAHDMYEAELQHFLQCIKHKMTPRSDLGQAKKVLEVALAAHASTRRNLSEPLHP